MPTSERTRPSPTLDCHPGREYDEEAFRYFLAVERARADRANRPLQLLIAALEPVPGKPAPISRATAARLFAGLRLSLRETDIVGWYRQDRVAGAVLSEHADRPGRVVETVIRERVGNALRRRLPSGAARSLQVDIIQVAEPQLGNG